MTCSNAGHIVLANVYGWKAYEIRLPSRRPLQRTGRSPIIQKLTIGTATLVYAKMQADDRIEMNEQDVVGTLKVPRSTTPHIVLYIEAYPAPHKVIAHHPLI